jgi:ADP-ribosylation factor GTPase-activating protein 1
MDSNVIQPSLAKAQDPNLQAQIYSQMSTLGTTLGQVGQKGGEVLGQTLRSGGTLMRTQMGVDVGDSKFTFIMSITLVTKRFEISGCFICRQIHSTTVSFRI